MNKRILAGLITAALAAVTVSAAAPPPAQAVVAHVVPSACTQTHPRTVLPRDTDKTYLAVGPGDFREQVECILEDDRSWTGIRPVSDVTLPDFVILYQDEEQANRFCGKPYGDPAKDRLVSCNMGWIIVMNANRWAVSTEARIGVINHEVGHQLGYPHGYAGPCSVMSNPPGCASHPWPPTWNNKLSAAQSNGVDA